MTPNTRFALGFCLGAVVAQGPISGTGAIIFNALLLLTALVCACKIATQPKGVS